MRALVACLVFSACHRTPTSRERATLYLDEAWQPDLWSVVPVESRSLSARAAFSLPPERAHSDAVLVFEDLMWQAAVTVNGTALPPITGGIGPVRLPVGEHLRAGENVIDVVVTSDDTVPSVLRGTDRPQARLGSPPRLAFGPEDGLSGVVGYLDTDGVHAAASAPAGARITAEIARDGERLRALGAAPLTGGRAETAGVPWDGARWPAPDSLVFVWVTLEDAAGNVLDKRAVRAGFRTVALDERDLMINDTPTRLLAVRQPRGPLDAGVHALLEVGANTLEYHGIPATERGLSLADELGLFVVDMPRCDGHVHARPEQLQAHDAAMAVQDLARIQAAGPHPSMVLWSSEGAPQMLAPILERYAADPVPRLTADVDLPSVPIAIGEQPREPGAWWNLEVTIGHNQHHAAADEAIQTFQAIIGAGAIGTHVPAWHPGSEARSVATARWRAQAAAAGIQRPEGPRRAPARISVTGLAPGQTAWARAAWHPTVAAAADEHGTAHLELWHTGPATISVGETTAEITVEAGTWELPETTSRHNQRALLASAWSGTPTALRWPPGSD